MVVPNPRLCLCLLWCHQIAHFILSLSCASNNSFPHFPPHHICILVYFSCPSEPSVTFFLWLCLSHAFSTLHFVLSCTALCIIFLDGLKVFFLPRASCEIAVLYCVWSGRTTRLQSLSLSLWYYSLFVQNILQDCAVLTVSDRPRFRVTNIPWKSWKWSHCAYMSTWPGWNLL